MNRNILVKSDPIETLMKKTLDYVREIEDEIDKLSNLKNDFIWEGKAHDAAMIKYDEMITDLRRMNRRLHAYIFFLDVVLKNYGEGLEKIRKELEKYKLMEEERARRKNYS